jgi:thioester reductase-like protein
LLTGATGFVGMELLVRYLERTERQVAALIRAPSQAAAEARLAATLENLFGPDAPVYADRVRVLRADLTAPGLGLSAAEREELAGTVTTIVHGAASVSFDLPLDEARAINVEGTRRMLELAQELPRLERYAHVSTAYVAGTHRGRFTENDLDLRQQFRNTYEKSKFEAEQLVRSRPEIPSTIFRPSIVVGDRHSGWTAAFNVLYWPLRAFARGVFTEVPAVATAPVDAVSVDYVADAVHALCESTGGVGQTYHLIAGAHASTIQEIAGAASRYFKRPPPRMLAPENYDGPDEVSVYFPYFCVQTQFDDAATRARLSPMGISVSPLRDYLERLLDFATLSRWGKRPIARVDALAA